MYPYPKIKTAVANQGDEELSRMVAGSASRYEVDQALRALFNGVPRIRQQERVSVGRALLGLDTAQTFSPMLQKIARSKNVKRREAELAKAEGARGQAYAAERIGIRNRGQAGGVSGEMTNASIRERGLGSQKNISHLGDYTGPAASPTAQQYATNRSAFARAAQEVTPVAPRVAKVPMAPELQRRLGTMSPAENLAYLRQKRGKDLADRQAAATARDAAKTQSGRAAVAADQAARAPKVVATPTPKPTAIVPRPPPTAPAAAPGMGARLKSFAGSNMGKGILGGAAVLGAGALAYKALNRRPPQPAAPQAQPAAPAPQAQPVQPAQPAPMVPKVAAARTTEFFEKKAYLSTAERLFPEIRAVKTAGIAAPAVGAPSGGSSGTSARPTPSLKKAPASDTFGAAPTNSPLSGGSA